jgi:hypothetical protein
MATEAYQLTLQGSLNGQFRENVMHFAGNGVDTNDTFTAAHDLNQAFDLHLRNLWLACLPATYFLDLMIARRRSFKPSNTSHIQYATWSTPGTRGTDATAQQTCPCIFMVPTMGFLSGGKIFMPCVPQGSLANNQYAAGYVTAIDAFMTAAKNGVAGPSFTWNLVIYSRAVGNFANVVSWHLSPAIGFIHKRKLQTGRGTHKRRA